MPHGKDHAGSESLLYRGLRAWRERGLRALARRVAWKGGRRLFSPRLDDAAPSRRETLRTRVQSVSLAIWKDLPIESFAPERRLIEIVVAAPNAAGTFVFAPSIGWSTSLFQRPQQLARALARRGYLVFYAELFDPNDAIGFRPVSEGLYDCNVFADSFRVLKNPIVVAHTYNRYYLSNFRSPRVVYDFLDDLKVHSGDPVQIRQDHADLMRAAEVVLATSESLYEQAAAVRPDALLCPNAADYSHFHEPGLRADDELDSLVAVGKPIVLYYGALAAWFDYELLDTVAVNRPDLTFVLAGSDYDGSLPASGILSRANVHWLGPRQYESLPGIVQRCQVAVIPFKLTPVTHSTSPIKLFEYCAAGKPTVTTPMRECLRYPGVLTAATADDFSMQLDQAIQCGLDPEYLKTIDAIARENTWDARADQILKALADSQTRADADRTAAVEN
ncbi:MAG: glycosyltransferase [Chloroflexi bacterium]|nr:glycosyltransferase [Chloroflexota bacterium]